MKVVEVLMVRTCLYPTIKKILIYQPKWKNELMDCLVIPVTCPIMSNTAMENDGKYETICFKYCNI